MFWKELSLSICKNSYFIDVLHYIERNYNFKPLLFLGWQSQPASATLRNIFEKTLGRCQKIELFPWSGIDFLSNPGYFPIRNGADVRAESTSKCNITEYF